jgi:hypothetical protein
LIVRTRWGSPVGLPVTVEADYRRIVPTFVSSSTTVIESAPDSFEIVYRLPIDRGLFVADGESIPVVIVGRDPLCNTMRDSTIHIAIDNTGPSTAPRLDPLPREWNNPNLTIAGTAVDADVAVIIRNKQHRYSAPVDTTTNRFSIDLDLDPGSNTITGWSEDAIGNKSFSGPIDSVLYVSGRSLTYPTPFRPKQAFVLQDAEGLRGPTIQIYNLEGDMVVELHQDGTFFETRLAWDGRGRDGGLAQPGYYMIRSRYVGRDGKSREEVLPLLFQNDE